MTIINTCVSIQLMKAKIDRNQRMYDYWVKHPGMSYQALANRFHISKPRAWLIIKEKKLEEYEITTIVVDKPFTDKQTLVTIDDELLWASLKKKRGGKLDADN